MAVICAVVSRRSCSSWPAAARAVSSARCAAARAAAAVSSRAAASASASAWVSASASAWRVLPGAENADVGGVHDADGERGNSGGVVGEVPGYVGTVPD
jgi:hypothetical protein